MVSEPARDKLAHVGPVQLGCGHATECGGPGRIELPCLPTYTFVPRSAPLACGHLLVCSTSRRARRVSEHSKLILPSSAQRGQLLACIVESNATDEVVRLVHSIIRHLGCTLLSLVH